MNKKTVGKFLSAIIVLVLIPSATVLNALLVKNGKYMLFSVIVALLSCIPFFIAFETGKNTAKEMVVIAAMIALSVVGRLIFAPLPGFKPVTALIIITGIAFGAESGFITGSMTALVSNAFYGQGPWTPFQMFTWGITGFIAGLIFCGREKRGVFSVVAVGVLGGVLYSLTMDVYTTLSVSGEFVVGEYLLNVYSSLPFMAVYAVSNAVFLLVLTKPLTEKLERLKVKYGIFKSRFLADEGERE